MSVPIQNILALKKIIERLNGKDIDWTLTGSTALAIHGVDVAVHDIDILADAKNADRIAESLKDFTVEPMHMKESPQFKSYYGSFSINNVQIEVIADIERQKDGEWRRADIPRLKMMKRFEGMNLPLLDIQEEYEAYKAMGRLEKAGKIKKFIDEQEKNEHRRSRAS